MDELRSEMDRLTRSERDLRSIIESAPVAMVMVGQDGGIVLFNAEAERIFGYRREEVLSRPVEILMPERYRRGHPGMRAGYSQAPEPRAMGHGRELYGLRKDGTEFHVEIGLTPIQLGGETWVLSTIVDISARKRSELALRESEERFRTLADNMSQFAWMADGSGAVFWYNQRWYDYTGTTLEEVQGWDWKKVHHPDHVDRVVERMQQCWDSGEPWEDTFPLRGRDGRYRWFLSRALPIRDESGRIVRWFGTNTDITEQRLAEEGLRRSEATLNAVLDTLPVGVVISDLNGAVVRDNAATRELWGISPEAASWKDFGEWVAWRPATGERIQPEERAVTRALKHGEVTRNELIRTQRFDSGEARYCLNNVAPLRNVGGRIVGAVAAMLDVTEQRAAEEALRRSEERYRVLTEVSPQAVWMADREGACIYANQWWLDYSGLTIEQTLGLGWLQAVDPGHRTRIEDAWREALRTGSGVWEAEIPFRRAADGQYRWHLTRARATRDEGGQVAQWMGTAIDIHERKQAEEALRHSEQRFRGTFETAAVGIAHVAPDGRWLRVNDKLCKIVGYKREQLLAMTFDDLSEPADRELHRRQAVRLIRGEIASYSMDMRYAHRSNGRLWLALNVSLMRRPDGSPDYFVAVIRNITTRKHLEESLRALSENLSREVDERTHDLREARDAAEAASRAKSEFLANMSHEIRTPMNGVQGMTELLLRTSVTPEQRHYLELVRQSADSLLVLINDILDFSKIEAGKLELFPMEFDLRETLGATLQSLGHRAGEKGLELAYRVAPEIPRCLVGDAGRLRQIVVNLVGNAIKFTSSGEIVAEVGLESCDERQVTLHFRVRDTGCGIPPQKLEAIFEPFNQGDNSSQRRFGGTGLGLSISRQLAALMDGQIWMESAVGEGTTVHFTARLDIGDPACVAASAPPESLHGLRVLVADDNATNRETLREMLRAWDMEPLLAKNGTELLSLLEAHEADPVRLVLLDMLMPDKDGEQVAREICQRWKERAPRMVVLSSLGQMIPVRKLHELGITRVLTKPVRASQLLDAITTALGTAHGDAAQAESLVPGRAGRSLRVLLAEDNAVNRLVAVKLLEERGHSVVAVDNGAKVLRALEEDWFDAVLMDVHMPEMDGLTAAREIRIREQDEALDRIPIIALTADAMEADRERCLEAGMDGYVAKPVRSAELYAALEQAALPGRGGGLRKEPAPEQAVFDPEAFRAAMGDPGLMREMIDVFQEDAARWLETAELALVAGDGIGLHRAAHALKGMIGNFTAAEPFRAVSELNDLTRDGRFTPEVKAKFPAVRDQVQQLQGELEKLGGELAHASP